MRRLTLDINLGPIGGDFIDQRGIMVWQHPALMLFQNLIHGLGITGQIGDIIQWAAPTLTSVERLKPLFQRRTRRRLKRWINRRAD